MESEASHDKAIPIFREAVHEGSLLGIPPQAISQLFWNAITYPGYLVDKLSKTRFGKATVSASLGAIGTLLTDRLKRYIRGDPSMQHATDFFHIPRNNLEWRLAATGAFAGMMRHARGSNHRLVTEWTRSFKRFKKLKLAQHQHVTRPWTIPYKPVVSLAKNAAVSAGALGLGTAALKYTGKLFRKLFHRN